MKRALVSVHDKTGLVDFGRRLVATGVELVASGGTADTLETAGLRVTRVAKVTGAPEMLGGRVKTLHPSIHGAILARPDQPGDLNDLGARGIEPFQLVVVNLYPFRETVANSASTRADVMEEIDIGGPAMIRAAAKNHDHVAVVVAPDQYHMVADAIENGALDAKMRRDLAAEAFFVSASYEAAIVDWFGVDHVLALRSKGALRYGENPHQEAGLFLEVGARAWWADAIKHQGKDMSFNNYGDTEAAWRLACDLRSPAAVVVKHMNPAGAAIGATTLEAFERAWDGDSLAAFGGVVAINGVLDGPTAESIAGRFVEVVVALDVVPDASTALEPKKSLRLLSASPPTMTGADYRRIEGGFLRQERDNAGVSDWKVVSEREPTPSELTELEFSWTVCRHVKSNAVVVARRGQTVGVGAGDQSRVGAAERAVVKAGPRAVGAVAASDAFFPFRDGIDTLVESGITAIVEPGGSVRDAEVIDAANEHGIALVFTGRRHFLH